MHARVLPFVAVLLALVGCAPSNPGIEIEALLAENDECTYMPSATIRALLSPVLDTVQADWRPTISYTATVQVVNRMLNLGNDEYPLMADPNTFYPREAEIELRGVDGSPLDVGGLPSRFRVPVSGVVPSAASGTELGRGAVAIQAIPPVYGDALAGRTGTIVVAMELRGTTSGDSTQTTAEYQFVLELCVGCLFQCVEDEEGPLPPDPSCRPGQDALTLYCAPPPPPDDDA